MSSNTSRTAPIMSWSFEAFVDVGTTDVISSVFLILAEVYESDGLSNIAETTHFSTPIQTTVVCHSC